MGAISELRLSEFTPIIVTVFNLYIKHLAYNLSHFGMMGLMMGLATFTQLVKVRRVPSFWHFQVSDFHGTFTRSSLALSTKLLSDPYLAIHGNIMAKTAILGWWVKLINFEAKFCTQVVGNNKILLNHPNLTICASLHWLQLKKYASTTRNRLVRTRILPVTNSSLLKFYTDNLCRTSLKGL